MGRAQEGLSLASLARDGRLILHVHHIGPKDPPEGWRGFLSCSSKQSSSAEASGLSVCVEGEWAGGWDHKGASDPLLL